MRLKSGKRSPHERSEMRGSFPESRISLRSYGYALRVQHDLSNWINVMLPVQSPSQKYSGSLLTQITFTTLAIPAHTRGRFAIVTNVGLGCDGRELRD